MRPWPALGRVAIGGEGEGGELEYMKDTMQNESKGLVLGHNVYKYFVNFLPNAAVLKNLYFFTPVTNII